MMHEEKPNYKCVLDLNRPNDSLLQAQYQGWKRIERLRLLNDSFIELKKTNCITEWFSVFSVFFIPGQDHLLPEAEEISMISAQLAARFLFSTGFHTKKVVRGPASDWYVLFPFCLFFW